MAQTKEEKREANKKAVEKYHSNLMLFKVQPHKSEGEAIKDYAKAHDMSAQGLFLAAVREYMHPSTDTGSAQGLSNDQIRRLKILYNGLVDQENAAYKQATYAKATPAEHARNTSAYNTALSRLGIVQAVFEIIGLDYEMGRRFKIDD